MKKILVPTDFSDSAQNALDFAIDIAKDDNALVYILHVIEYPIGATIDPIGVSIVQPTDTEIIDTLTKNAREKMEVLHNKYQDLAVVTKTFVDIGTPYLGIVEKISDENIDLVIMGSHGAKGFKEFFIGSNAEKVVRHSPCPVITLKDTIDKNNIKDIVFASDFKELSDDVIEHLKEVQKTFEAQLHFVKINTPNNFEKDRVNNELIKQMIEQHKFDNCTYNVYNDVYEEDGLIHYAEDNDVDMIAMATHGRTGISHLISGSIAEDVVNHAKRPVWTYHINKN